MHYEVDKTLAAMFETRLEAMWDRATNRKLDFGSCEQDKSLTDSVQLCYWTLLVPREISAGVEVA